MTDILLYAGVGVFAGFFAGLLGLGGGAMAGALLILIFNGRPDFPPESLAHIAIGTALAAAACTTAPSALTHARVGNINRAAAKTMTTGATLGAIVGALFAERAPSELLKLLLALFLLRSSAQMFFPGFNLLSAFKNGFRTLRLILSGESRNPSEGTDASSFGEKKLTRAGMLFASLGIGGVSALLGIGGGALTVPYLVRRGLAARMAIGTSALVAFPLSLSAALIFAWRGGVRDDLPPDSIGFIYLPAFIGVALFSGVFAVIGARATGKFPDKTLRHIFALITLLLALRLLALLLE